MIRWIGFAILALLALSLPIRAQAQSTVNTPGWHAIPNSELKGSGNASPCPPDNFWSPVFPIPPEYLTAPCSVILDAWGSTMADPVAHRTIIFGGGHNDYGGNELYELDETKIGGTAPLYRLTNPSSPNTSAGVCVETLSDGRPNSRHTYDGLVFDPAHYRMYAVGGSLNNCGNPGNGIWSLDLTTVGPSCAPTCSSSWTEIASNGDIGSVGNTTDYDPNTGRIWIVNQSYIGYINTTTNTYTRAAAISQYYNSTGVVDPDDQYFVYIGANGALGGGAKGITYFSIASGSSYTQTIPTLDASCPNFNSTGPSANYPGAFWDPVAHRIVIYPNGGNVLYYIYPKNWTCSSETYGSTQGTDYPQDTANLGNGSGTFKKFAYDSSADMVVLCNSGANNCWYLHMRRGDPVITNNTGGTLTNQPYSISQPFRQGDIPNYPQAYLNGTSVATQADVKNRWPDGSVKFAIVSFLIPSLASGAVTHVTYDNQSSGNNTGFLSQANMLGAGYNFDGRIQLTGTASHNISARAILTAAGSCNDPGTDPDAGSYECSYWLKGSIVTAVILEDRSGRTQDVNTDAGTGNPLHPIFEAWFYPQTNQVQLGYTLEDSWASTTAANSARDQTYSLVLTGGNTSPATEYTNASFTQITRSRWHKTFCINGTGTGTANTCWPTIHLDHEWPYWSLTHFLPHWDTTITIAPSLISSWTNSYAHSTALQGDGNGIANFDFGLNSAGAAPWHGPLTTWDIVYLLSQDDGVKTEVLANADLGGRIPYWYREADTSAGHGAFFDAAHTIATQGRVVSINARTQVSLNDVTSQSCNTNFAPDWINFGGGGQDTGAWDLDTTHWPNLAYVSYLSTGQYAYYEEQIMQSAYALGDFPGSRSCVQGGLGSLRQGADGYWYIDEERGTNWMARENALGAFIAIDGSPEKTYFLDKLNTNLAVWEGAHSIANDISGCLTVSCATAWTYGNVTRGQNYTTVGGSVLGSWTRGLSAYVANAPLNQTGGSSPGTADAHFQLAYGAIMVGWINDLGYCPGSCGMLSFVANHYINQVLNPAANMHQLADYVYPTSDNSSAQTGISTWSQAETFYASITTTWPLCANITIDEPYAQEGAAALSFMTGITSSQGSYSGSVAYNNVRTTMGCITGSTGHDFASGSPKWDITPRNQVQAGSCPSAPCAAGPLTPSASNSRYWVRPDTGKPVVLVGSHTWNDAQDIGTGGTAAVFDFNSFVSFLQAHGHNATILWKKDLPTECNWQLGMNWVQTPWPWNRTGPGNASDGGLKFDLTSFNATYFNNLHAKALQLYQANIYAIIEVFDGNNTTSTRCGTNTSPNGDGGPFTGANNINSVDDNYTSGTAGVGMFTMTGTNAVTAAEDAFVQHLVTVMDDLPNVIYEIAEEQPGTSFSGTSGYGGTSSMTFWAPHVFSVIRTAESSLTFQHPVGIGSMNSNDFNDATLYASTAGWIGPQINNNFSNQFPANVATNNQGKVVINDSDHSQGASTLLNSNGTVNNTQDRKWIWENVTSGAGAVLFMDPYDIDFHTTSPVRNTCPGSVANSVCSPTSNVDAKWNPLRDYLGYVLEVTNQVDLSAMTPQGGLASTGFVLANNSATNASFIVYQPNTASFTVNLSTQANHILAVQWLNPQTGVLTSAAAVAGGAAAQSFTAPSGTDAVLLLTENTAPNPPNPPTNVNVTVQ